MPDSQLKTEKMGQSVPYMGRLHNLGMSRNRRHCAVQVTCLVLCLGIFRCLLFLKIIAYPHHNICHPTAVGGSDDSEKRRGMAHTSGLDKRRVVTGREVRLKI